MTKKQQDFILMKIKLQKINERGSKQFWNARIVGNKATFNWGQEGGKFQTKVIEVAESKNVGKVNESSPEDQVIKQTVNKARKKVDSGYEIIEGADLIKKYTNETVAEVHDIPKCMLAQVFQHHVKKFSDPEMEVDVQPKLDGNRMVCNVKTGKLYSRSRKEILGVPHISKAIKIAFRDSKVTWIDGEVYSHDITFNEIQSIVRRTKDIDEERAKKISFHIFDVITYDDWTKRKSVLEWFRRNIENKYINITKTYRIKIKNLQKWHDKFVAEGYEGIMIRLPEGLYEGKRSMSLLKYKAFFDIDAKILSIDSERNDSTKLGSLKVEWEDKIFNARPACSDEQKEEIFKNQEKYIGKYVVIKYQELDARTGVPRFPVATIKIRIDSDLIFNE